jgi:hypothetical protein
LKNEDTVIDVGGVVERLVAVARFGAPDFWGYVNDERSDGGESR